MLCTQGREIALLTLFEQAPTPFFRCLIYEYVTSIKNVCKNLNAQLLDELII